MLDFIISLSLVALECSVRVDYYVVDKKNTSLVCVHSKCGSPGSVKIACLRERDMRYNDNTRIENHNLSKWFCVIKHLVRIVCVGEV